MPRNEHQTRKDLIEPALEATGWHWEREVLIGPVRLNLTGAMTRFEKALRQPVHQTSCRASLDFYLYAASRNATLISISSNGATSFPSARSSSPSSSSAFTSVWTFL